MQRGVPINVHYISMMPEVVEKHYGHFAPDFHQEVIDAWETKPKKAGKKTEKSAAYIESRSSRPATGKDYRPTGWTESKRTVSGQLINSSHTGSHVM